MKSHKISYVLSIVYLALLCGVLSSCNKKQPKFTNIPSDGVILAFGDSLTVGNGTTIDNSYPSVLAKLSGHKIINAGISGETTTDGLSRFAKVLDNTKPNLVIIMEGGNDVLQNQDPKVTKQNLVDMIQEARSAGVQVMLVGTPTKSIMSSKPAKIYEEVAKQTRVFYDSSTIASIFGDKNLKSDIVHFNTEGYKQMAEKFYTELKNNGALN